MGSPHRAILGLDYGQKRVGVAIGLVETGMAFPLETYPRVSRRADTDHFRQLCQEHRVGLLVVGLPTLSSGSEGQSARRARAWGQELAAELNLPIIFFDERYSTTEAENLLRESGLKASSRKARRDMLAAQILLQAYLDAGAPTDDQPGSPLDDHPKNRSS